jgi:hypothetical protein
MIMMEFKEGRGGDTMKVTLCDGFRGSTMAWQMKPMAVRRISVFSHLDVKGDEVGPEVGVHR